MTALCETSQAWGELLKASDEVWDRSGSFYPTFSFFRVQKIVLFPRVMIWECAVLAFNGRGRITESLKSGKFFF